MRGTRVVIAGAGLAGLAAARDLTRRGAVVDIFEARDRLGGRVWTSRDAPLAPFHGELGGELIDRDHDAIRALCREYDLPLKRILLRGFGLAVGHRDRVRVFSSQSSLWKQYSAMFAPEAEVFEQATRDWGSTAAAVVAAQSVATVLERRRAPARVRAQAAAFRNFWVADPDQLSALVATEQVIDGDPSTTPMFRIRGGTDRLVDALADEVRGRVHRRHIVRAVIERASDVIVKVESPRGQISNVAADYVVLAVPAALLPQIALRPALPDAQRHAIESLQTGPATKALLRFSTTWWRAPGRPRAFGSNLAIGAVWDASEDQPNGAVLTLLAGGRASAALQRLLERPSPGLVRQLDWMGDVPREIPRVHAASWEHDPWARGAYAFFGPRFDPALRPLLARAAGRVHFAGCHTSREFQGYMNGAVESGVRVAREIAQAARLRA